MEAGSSRDVTTLLSRIRSGDAQAREQLFTILYDELRVNAGRLMQGQPASHTLQATALMGEAYLRICRSEASDWNDRAHFFAVATSAMKCVLIDHARTKARAKRGGGRMKLRLEGLSIPTHDGFVDVLDLTDALGRLAEFDPRAARIVDLRFFGGLTTEDAARVEAVSKRAAERDWTAARAWLRKALS